MSLDEYKNKRTFTKTSEPTGGKPASSKLQFVVQKHAASHLHYDFRLEMRGVLKSWAVPKGVSLNPEERRLAMQTEDHPYDYLHFEGVIPKGQYGGGTVIVWDTGTFETTAIKEKDKKSQEHSLLSQYYKGRIVFTLHGKKLKGEFEIIRAKEKGEKSWYLRKMPDKYAAAVDITKKDKSVLTSRTIEQVGADPNSQTWQSNRAGKEKPTKQPSTNTHLSLLLQQGVQAPMPQTASPMECKLIREPFNREGWIYELKFDGYRVLSFINDGRVTLSSRSGLDYTKDYPVLIDPLKEISHNAILDGEIVVLDEKGHPDFTALQQYRQNKTADLRYFVFDLLWLDGYDITKLILTDRRKLLREIIKDDSIIQFSQDLEEGVEMFNKVKEMGLEGLVYKKANSTYQNGKRGNEWLKLPTKNRQEFIVGGWTESESAHAFRSLLFGAYENGELNFIGHAGHGFKGNDRKGILKRLEPLEITENPFVNDVNAETTVHYVKPQLIANIEFATWTGSGKIRKPAIFLGFRDDKKPEQVIPEIPMSVEEEHHVIDEKGQAVKGAKSETAKKIETSAGSNWPELEKQKITSEDVFTIEGKDVKLTNIEREIWKGITKSDLIVYYHNVASYILPYLKDRPQSLHIKHKGPTAPGMYIKDMEGRQPKWAEIFTVRRKHKKKGKRDLIDYLVLSLTRFCPSVL